MEVLQVPSELKQMVALYKERKPNSVLEIGSWDGGTLRVWLQNAVRDATVVAVDLEHRNSQAYGEWTRDDVTLELRIGSSLDNEGREFIIANGPYDWMLVDGDHTLHGAETDVQTCIEAAVSGALMLIHDITPGTRDISYPPQVVFDRLSETYETWTFQDPAPAEWSRGIGVVQL